MSKLFILSPNPNNKYLTITEYTKSKALHKTQNESLLLLLSSRWCVFLQPVQGDFLLLEVSAILFINQYKIQIILDAKLVVNVAMRWCKIVWCKKQSYRYRLACKTPHSSSHSSFLEAITKTSCTCIYTSNWGSIHQLKFSKCFCLHMSISTSTCWFPPPDLKIHILHLDPHKKKVYFPEDNIF